MTIEMLRVPDRRKPVLIGEGGRVKKSIEKKTNTAISINDVVEIEGEALDVLKARDIIKAIARGFSPEEAFLLLDESCRLIVISLTGEKESTIKRLMGRVIGRKGTTLKIIERETGSKIVVSGKTVSIICGEDTAQKAREAVENLLAGRTHGYVYRRLRKE
jgi:ribosomal RNA assembly protein